MNSSNSKTESGSPSRRFPHRFSDSGLHTTLMAAVLAIAALALLQAVTTGVAIWQLDTVVVQGQSTKR